jgi:hypothetical protein
MSENTQTQAGIPSEFRGKTIKTGLKVTTAALPGGEGWVKVADGVRAQRGSAFAPLVKDQEKTVPMNVRGNGLSPPDPLSLSLYSVKQFYNNNNNNNNNNSLLLETETSTGNGDAFFGDVSKAFRLDLAGWTWEGLHG